MKKVLSIALVSIVLCGCAVSQAAKKRGVELAEVMKCNTRTCFLSLRDSTILLSQKGADGSMSETYKILLEQGSAGRAVVHGLLDIATLGVWELAGTPIEGSMNKDEFAIVTANYDKNNNLITAKIGDRAVPNGVNASSPAAPASPDSEAKK